MKPAIIPIEQYNLGNSWLGIPTIGPITISVDGAPAVTPSSPIQSASLTFFKPGMDNCKRVNLTTGAGITIVDADTWELSVPAINEGITLEEGDNVGLLTITDADGLTLTYYQLNLPVNALP